MKLLFPLGGYNNPVYSNTAEIFDGESWSLVDAPMPEAFFSGCAVAIDDDRFV